MTHHGHASTHTAEGPMALLCGGGSGGHVFPGLAVVEELQQRGWRVAWSGSERGMERRLVTSRHIDFHALPARPLVGQGAVGKMRALFTLTAAAWRARSLVRRLDARVVVGTGGYVSAPAVLGARMARRPVVLLEPNAEVGFANRWLSRCAAEAAVVDASTSRQLACPSTQTGVPVRSEFFEVDAAPTSPLRLLVLGGSQGAQQINRLVPTALRQMQLDGPLEVVHQCGARHVESTQQAYAAAGVDNEERYRIDVVPFLDDMPRALEKSHLVISRAGAITLAELCAAGRASLLLPLSLAAAHQVGNAKQLVEAGAAEMLLADADENDMTKLLDGLLRDAGRRQAMAEAARSLGRPNAARDIADRVEHWADGGGTH